jgi:hypothetical protein
MQAPNICFQQLWAKPATKRVHAEMSANHGYKFSGPYDILMMHVT